MELTHSSDVAVARDELPITEILALEELERIAPVRSNWCRKSADVAHDPPAQRTIWLICELQESLRTWPALRKRATPWTS